jgi:diguanylate cyclase
MYVDNDRAQATARNAFAWLTQRNVPPVPENFQVAYGYESGERTDLKRELDGLISSGCKFDSNVMTILHQRYFGPPRNDDAVAALGEKISSELDSVLQLLQNASGDQSAYGKTLSKVSGDLGGTDLGAAALKTVVEQLIGATRAMEARSQALELQLQTSSKEVAELREDLESVRKESLIDQLTGVHNRKAFDKELRESIERSLETGDPLSLLMCDIDHFKAFNDTWGHQTGDQVLRLVANCLSENVKGRDTAARYGGEEFAVLLPQTGLTDAVNLANQIRGKVQSKKLVKKSTGDILGVITISIGVTQYDPNEAGEEFLRRADTCLYAAKRAGRNRVVSEVDGGILDAADTEAA